jgi:phage FluMu protein gp41
VTTETEFPFTLPRGYADADGTVHREGSMRLATAHDEIAPLRDPRVQANPAYLVVILLARVITRLGDLPDVNPRVIEELFAGDLAYLEGRYRELNDDDLDQVAVTCPSCEQQFDVAVGRLGG